MTIAKNPVLLLMIGLPAVAVVASVASLALALESPDTELPEQYHWEGFQLDRDFSRSEQATQLGVQATLTGIAASGPCAVALTISGPPPERLQLMLAHATRADLDQRVQFQRTDDSGSYIGRCNAIPDGHWRIELTDAARSWSVRSSVREIRAPVQVDATKSRDD